MKELLFGILGFFAVGIGIIIAITNKFSKKLYNVKEVDILKMEDVIIFFKKKEILDKLKSNNNFLAVAIKENKKDYYQILCAIYDKSKEKVLDIDNCALMFKAKDIDIDLKNAFGDKDMIVLN
ncbi:hypothetical protein EPJ64_05575 [Brachyspira aalborgi]|jgi:hypothetical protein|uniref:Uncharacterized protein n=1 Tax=Brachyspira aalborgi TaxID=29522 RepID=A0AB38PZH5_9SPIR|nr:hypothetical protein [Brachyspira aalborgi]MBS4762948.1 hypothetical protein [Brachyspira sp.]CCY75941.1 putative uncharacterized protein [Brachyspira sp. CAG:700]TXJ15682.1 hypothetical protein EPJ77_05425 [Brachyspira aalborgi]TXJ18956.1 hypothetical protein EPJ64_05575 [Brachyspira aalborgi]TXJ25072.1 hypothetical protein EPJ73_06255 [Brachyspira aalborgi]